MGDLFCMQQLRNVEGNIHFSIRMSILITSLNISSCFLQVCCAVHNSLRITSGTGVKSQVSRKEDLWRFTLLTMETMKYFHLPV